MPAQLSSLRSPDADAVPAFHVSAPGPAAEIARNSSRCDARVRAHVPGGSHRAIARNATREGTGGAGNLNDPVGHLYCASVSGLTRSGFCPKHSAPHAVEFACRICARHRGNHRSDALGPDQQTSGMVSHANLHSTYVVWRNSKAVESRHTCHSRLSMRGANSISPTQGRYGRCPDP